VIIPPNTHVARAIVVETVENQSRSASPWGTDTDGAYRTWRAAKLEGLVQNPGDTPCVELSDLANPSPSERAELLRQCDLTNAVHYASATDSDDSEKIRVQLTAFSAAMGLRIAEKHRSADADGIVALRQTDMAAQRGYIPYSNRPMNWHTDGYYNAPDQKIRAVVLHCVSPAADGGVNQFFDPEIAYIRLRDENPEFIDALMHPAAMTIPENREKDGALRPASVGPVFAVSSTGHLEMRYTARTRSITWRDDPVTAQAVEFLQNLLMTGDMFTQTVTLQAGQGVLCNNSLHNRTGFDASLGENSDRLLYRIRFHNRVSGS